MVCGVGIWAYGLNASFSGLFPVFAGKDADEREIEIISLACEVCGVCVCMLWWCARVVSVVVGDCRFNPCRDIRPLLDSYLECVLGWWYVLVCWCWYVLLWVVGAFVNGLCGC